MKFFLTAIAMLVLLASALQAAEADTEAIEYLLDAIGSSDCTFIRNGGEHSAADAEKHLRMKYRRGKKWVTDAESFISRIATRSSFSGKPYRIQCGDEEALSTADWLRATLAERRGLKNGTVPLRQRTVAKRGPERGRTD